MSKLQQPAGMGRKRPQLNVVVERLSLDVLNPRLPEEIQGSNELEILEHLLWHFDLDELADSMGQNGYFDEEPLVAIPENLPDQFTATDKLEDNPDYLAFIKEKSTRFIVLEGNRRLSTAKLLLDSELRRSVKLKSWIDPSENVRNDLSILPVIVYPTRKEVLPYLGVRHISGNKKWESYARARYIAEMIREGYTVESIEKQIGDKAGVVRLNAICYHLLRTAREDANINIKSAKDNFSLLQLAIGQAAVKRFLGWVKPNPKDTSQTKTIRINEIDLDDPVDEKHLEKLVELLSFIYGDGDGKTKVITESRDITKKLAPVLANNAAAQYLRENRNLEAAYEMSDGEETMMKRALVNASRNLDKALGVAHRNRSTEIIEESKKCVETANRVLKVVTEKDDV